MTMAKSIESTHQLCALIARAQKEPLIGTATAFDHFIAIEVAGPWPRKVWQAETVPTDLPTVLAQAEARGLKLRAQALVPDETTPQGRTRLLYFRRPANWFAFYEKAEFVLPTAQVAALVDALLTPTADLTPFKTYRQTNSTGRDILVCTHGSRDACCGKFGYALYTALQQQGAQGVRLWRTSHIGGHRFAATLLDLPSGHYWGHLDPVHLPLLLNRSGDLNALLSCYRGWAGLNKIEQIAEREIWQREGWAWLDYRKRGRTLRYDETSDTSHVRLDFIQSDGTPTAYEATIEPNGSILTMKSSGDADLTPMPQYRVSLIRQV